MKNVIINLIKNIKKNNYRLLMDIYYKKFKCKKYLKNNKINEISYNFNSNLNVNFIGKVKSKDLDKLDVSMISELENSIVFCDGDFNNNKINNTLFLGHSKNEIIIIKNNDDKKIAYISYSPKKNVNDSFKDILLRVYSAKKCRADYIILYVKTEKNDEKLGGFTKKLATIGVNHILINFCDEKEYKHTVIKSTNKTSTKVFYSLDDLKDNKISAFFNYNVNLNDKRVDCEYYYLLKFANNKLSYCNDVNKISEYNDMFVNLKEKSKVLYIEDVLKIIGIECPEKLKYLKKSSYKKIASKIGEVGTDDIFFLLEPYKYKNDTTTATDSTRLKQARKAYDKGTKLIISYMKLNTNIPYILCDNVREAHIKLLSYIHSLNNIKTIAITGSVGKTTTKDMLASVLSQKYNTLESPLNGNLQIPIGKNIQKLNPNQDFYIQEVGGGRPGGASRHSRMINPVASLITNIGTAHLGNFENQEDLMKHKLGIVDGMPKDGIFFQNYDDELLKNAELKGLNVVSYSTYDTNADYYASNIKYCENHIEFIINKRKTKEQIKAIINIPGIHNVLNAVACFAIGDNFGLSTDQILKGLADFKTAGIRQNLVKLEGKSLMLDCYNASLDSIKTSLESFNSIDSGKSKKIIVIGDVTGVGDAEESIHVEIAEEIEKYSFDEVILYGNSIKMGSDYLRKNKYNHKYFKLKQRKDVCNYLKNVVNDGDYILFKGSSKVSLESIIDDLYYTNLTLKLKIGEKHCKTLRKNDLRFKGSKKQCMVTSFKNAPVELNIPKKIKKYTVKGIEDDAFRDCVSLKNVKLSDKLTYIGCNAFLGCINLNDINFNNTVIIDENAFSGCESLTKINFSDSLLHISSNAFKDCKNLEKVYLPDSIKEIDENAFSGCKKLTIYCSKNGYAYQYAKENKIKIKEV